MRMKAKIKKVLKKKTGKESVELWNADPNCHHKIKEGWSGIKCIKCGGWFCY